jgi:hypothetical protein
MGVSHASAKKMAQRLRETIERSLGALLVSRRVRNNTFGCAELAVILDGWDGKFTVLMRKRVARHIESCPACDQERRRLVNPAALLGAAPVFVPAPDWLRDRTLSRIQLTGTTTLFTSPGTPSDDDRVDVASGNRSLDGAGFRRRRVLVVVALLAAVIAAIGVTIVWLHERDAPMTPVNITEHTPTPSAAPRTADVPPSTPPPAAPTEGSAMPTTPAVGPPPPVAPPAPPTTAPAAPTGPVVAPTRPPSGSTAPVTPTNTVVTPKPRPVTPPEEPTTSPAKPPNPVLTQPPQSPVTKKPPTSTVIE